MERPVAVVALLVVALAFVLFLYFKPSPLEFFIPKEGSSAVVLAQIEIARTG